MLKTNTPSIEYHINFQQLVVTIGFNVKAFKNVLIVCIHNHPKMLIVDVKFTINILGFTYLKYPSKTVSTTATMALDGMLYFILHVIFFTLQRLQPYTSSKRPKNNGLTGHTLSIQRYETVCNQSFLNLNGLTLEKYQEYQSANSTSGVTHCDRSIACHGSFIVVDLLSMCAVTVWQ